MSIGHLLCYLLLIFNPNHYVNKFNGLNECINIGNNFSDRQVQNMCNNICQSKDVRNYNIYSPLRNYHVWNGDIEDLPWWDEYAKNKQYECSKECTDLIKSYLKK